jgi:hypothetical protein
VCLEQPLHFVGDPTTRPFEIDPGTLHARNLPRSSAGTDEWRLVAIVVRSPRASSPADRCSTAGARSRHFHGARKLVGHRVVGACDHDGVTDESIEVVGRGPDDPALLLRKPIAMAS